MLLMLNTLWACCLDCTDIFPSTFVEWEPLEALSGTFEAHHFEIGSLLYSGCAASELVERSIFFFDAEYVVPTSRNGCGTLRAISSPTLMVDDDWPTPDNTSIALTGRRIESDVFNAMKCTYGSHRATLTSFMPLHLFVFLFRVGHVHRTPTMWIAKGGTAMDAFLPPAWDCKIVQHNGDSIKCMVVKEKIIVRYHIAKQQLSIIFPYRRWKQTRGDWQALDSDIIDMEQVDVHVCKQDEVWDVAP